MSLDLQNFLAKTHSLICFVDLASVSQSQRQIFKLFTTHYKTSYDPKDRLVLYTQCLPDQELLDTIQKAASKVDISNCFILICCPYDLSQHLTQANKNFGTGADPIPQLQIDCKSDPLPAMTPVPDTVCVLPFAHLEINHQGVAKPCCVQKDVVGQVPQQSIVEIFNSEKMHQLREEFLSGQKPSGCSHCWQTEDTGVLSYRQAYLQMYEKEFFSDWITDWQIRSLDLKPGNVCNFKCRICSPAYSSLRANESLTHSEDAAVKIKIQNLIDNSGWFDNDKKFIDEFENLLDHIVNLDFYGGEPFLLKNLPRVLNAIVDRGLSQRIRLHFNTNGSVYPEKLLHTFTQFAHVDLAISIDNIGKRFELERGGVWKDIENNIVQMKNLKNDKLHVYIFCTVNIQNVLYLDELYDWATQQNLEVFFAFLETPWFYSIEYLTPEAKDLVFEKLSNSTVPELQNILKKVQKSAGSNGKDFVEHMQKLDKWRNQNFALTHSEIASAMGYVLQ